MIFGQKTAGFELPSWGSHHKCDRLLSAALKSRLGKPLPTTEPPEFPYWDAAYFGLDKVGIFRDSTPDEQQQILHLCSMELLAEAYFIEKAGVGYMAKMTLMAETTQERMLYAMFGADEATHLGQIISFLPVEPVASSDKFLQLLSELVETEDKSLLLFLMQVVLEGWGLTHYRSLAKHCRYPGLGQMFHNFLQEESRHHAAGEMIFTATPLSLASEHAIIEALTLFLRMVQAGPQRVVAVLERVKGHFSGAQKVKIFEELDTETHSGTRLAVLHGLMQPPNARGIVAELQQRGAFQPFSPSICAALSDVAVSG